MRSRVITAVAVTVLLVVGCAVALGLTAPDGSVRGATAPNVVTTRTTPTPSSTTPTATPTPEPTATNDEPSVDLAPAKVADVWPGRPKAVTVDGDQVDWCGAVKVSASSGATSAFGAAQTKGAACAAVSFVFDERYARRSLPKSSYKKSDFDSALSAFAQATGSSVYRPRIAAFVAHPTGVNGENLGLVMLQGQPGAGYRYYGKKNTLDGYTDRAAWINPQWSTVKITLDTSKVSPRLTASFTASAAVPVFDTNRGRDAMMTVPTTASLVMRREGKAWKIGSFQIHTGAAGFTSLRIR